MDARTSITNRLPSRPATESPERAPHAALHLPAITHDFDLFEAAEIFKKTPYVAGLKPGGRDVAKDRFQIGRLPFLTDIGALNGKLTDAQLAERKTKWKARKTNHVSGARWKYAQQVGPAVDGAVTRPGDAHEKKCHADV